MSLKQDIQSYLDPIGYVGLHQFPQGRDSDNSLLYTSIYLRMLADRLELRPEDMTWFEAMATMCEIDTGIFTRYPDDLTVTSWDDHLAVSCISRNLARDVWLHGNRYDWTWPNVGFLGRFPVFVAIAKSQSGISPSIGTIIGACGSYVWNMFESKEQTSGKILLWLSARPLVGISKYLDAVLNVWSWVMKSKYGSMKSVMEIYYGKNHPFTVYCLDDFI